MEYTDAAAAAQEPSLPPVPMPLPVQLPIATKIDAPTSPNKHSAASLLVGLSSDEQPTTTSQHPNNPLYTTNPMKPTVAKGPSTMSKKNNEDDVIVNAIVGANVKKGGVKNGRKKYYCKEEGCNNLVQLAGLCIKHGASRKKCSYEGCNNLAKVKGVCIKHGAKIVGKRCIHEGCNNWARKKGLCVKHGADRSNNRDTCILAEETAALAASIPPEAEVVAVPLLPPVLAEPNPMEPNPEENITHQI